MKVKVGGWAWLPRSGMTDDQAARLRSLLTIYPKRMHPKAPPSQPIYLYRETDLFSPEGIRGKFGIPRMFFFENQSGVHDIELDVTDGAPLPSPLRFRGELREGQQKALEVILTKLRQGTLGGILKAPTGWGKCLALGTEVIRSDGELVAVEDVREGDVLLGPDSLPREVLSTSRGSGPMYRIVPENGAPWECNDAHILTLGHTQTGEVKDVCVEDWLGWSKTQKHLWKQFAPEKGVDFYSGYWQASPVWALDPYFLGVWYGDSTRALNGVITKSDKEIESLCSEVAAQWGLHVLKVEHGGRFPTYHLGASRPAARNPLLDKLREWYIGGECLPPMYLRGSRETRLAFLAGLLDSDGHNNAGVLRICQKRKQWAKDIAFLGRSLGFKASIREEVVEGKSYWRVGLSGDFSEVPFRIARKDPSSRMKREVATRTGFSVESIGEGEWAGFTLSGDGRFLLGDFTVTHNTVYGCALAAALNVPTLIIVNKEPLIEQWEESVIRFLPGAEIGLVREDKEEFEGKHVVLATIQTLQRRGLPEGFADWPGLVVSDECHRMGAPKWSEVGPQFRARFRVGLSATPRRKDGAEAAFRYHIGEILHRAEDPMIEFKVKRVYTSFHVPRNDSFNPNFASNDLYYRFMITHTSRNRSLVLNLLDAVAAGRHVLFLSHRLKHLEIIQALFAREWEARFGSAAPFTGMMQGGMKKEVRRRFKREARVIFATPSYCGEGFNVPRLDTLFIGMPMSDVEQAVGRILREHDGKKLAIVVDFRDDRIRKFHEWGLEREALYNGLAEA